jgi:hypothetical protein
MAEPFHLHDLVWALTTLLQLTLLLFLVWRRLYRVHPAFSVYVLLTFLQSVLVAWITRQWGTHSFVYFDTAWGMQAAVICARWLAVVEIARRVLGGYSGIWKMASSLLFVLGLAVLLYAIALSERIWAYSVLNADRAVELCIAVFIVGLLCFARYYRLWISNLERQLAVGFALFSCSWVVSNSLFQGWRSTSGEWWDFFEILAFFATLLLWVNAVRHPVEDMPARRAASLTPGEYGQLSLEVNQRLRELNDRLNQLMRSKDQRP